MKSEANIVSLFVQSALQHGDTIAFIEKEQRTTYGNLLQQVQQTAIDFTRKGISKGNAVLVFVPMTTQLYVVVLAVLYIGAVPVFLDEWVSLQRLKACLQTVPCKAIIASRKLLFVSWFIRSLWPLKRIAVKSAVSNRQLAGKHEEKDASSAMAHVLPDDTALVTFTTGSTGTPKAANRTHRFLRAQYDALYPLLDNDCSITLTLLPVVILLNLCLGKTNILPVGKIKPADKKSVSKLLQWMQLQDVESLIASPAITVALAKAQLQQNGHSSVQQIITGGGPLFPEEAAMITNAFQNTNAMVVYGSTEAEPISIFFMQQLAATAVAEIQYKGLPVGKIHRDITVVIVPFTEAPLPYMDSITFEQLQLPTGISGELLVSGPHVLQQYLNNEGAQRQNKFWVNGQLWHRTGDEAAFDENGYLYFLGRCKEVILWNGEKLYPLLFTWLLKREIPVQEAALLKQNNKLLLVLQKADTGHHKTVKKYLEKKLPAVQIVWIEQIPKDKRHQTKIDYQRLQQQIRIS